MGFSSGRPNSHRAGTPGAANSAAKKSPRQETFHARLGCSRAAQAWQQGGGDVSGFLSYDPDLDLLYYGSGNPGPWNAKTAPRANKKAEKVAGGTLEAAVPGAGASLHGEVLSRQRDYIVEGNLAEGERVPARELYLTDALARGAQGARLRGAA